MTTLTADAQLVSAYLDGDRTALASIYDKYAAGLYDTAAAMLSDRHDAADMVQDVFCIAAERLNQLRDPDRLKPWLYAVLRNEVYRRTKKRKRATPTDFQAETTPDVVAAFDPNADGAAASYEELAELVRSAAAGLDERDRLVLELSVRQGLTGTDLADALGVTPEQSYTLVHRMRDRIEKSLGAFTVAKMGSKECNELATIISGWNGEFSILIRKRVARHIDDCSICERTRSKYAPLALFGAAPVFVLPFGLREKVLAATQSIPTPSKSADTHASKGSRGSQRSHHIKLNRNDGFPRLVRISRHAVAVIASTAAVLLLIAGLVLIQQSKESGNEYGDVLSADPIRVDTSTPTEDSVATSSMVDSSLTTTPTTTPTPTPTTTPTTTPGTDVPESETSIAAVSPPLVVTTTMSPAPTTTARNTSPLVTSTNVLNFARGVRASLKLTNNNSTAVMWSLAESSGFFTFVPSSGSVGAGATLTVTATFARASASALPEGEFNLLAALTTRGAPNTTLTLTGIVGQPPVIGTFTPYFSGLACSRLNIQVPITDESSLASVSAKITYTNPQATPPTATLTATLNDSGKGVWVTSLTSIPQTVTQVVVKVTATDIYGFSSTSETRINRTNSC